MISPSMMLAPQTPTSVDVLAWKLKFGQTCIDKRTQQCLNYLEQLLPLQNEINVLFNLKRLPAALLSASREGLSQSRTSSFPPPFVILMVRPTSLPLLLLHHYNPKLLSD